MARSLVPARMVAVLVALVLGLAATVGAVGRAPTASAGVGPSVLLIHSMQPADADDVVAGLTATGRFSSVTAFAATAATPVASDLDGIDVVIAAADGGFLDNDAIGELLADFVDAGGTVVETTFTLYCPEQSGLGGRWATGAYSALVGPSPACPDQLDGDGPFGLVPVVANSPLLAGVTSVSGGEESYRNLVTVAPGAILVANWNDEASTPFAAFTTAHPGCVVALNFFPVSDEETTGGWDDTTDGWVLLANGATFGCASPPPDPDPVIVVPTFTG